MSKNDNDLIDTVVNQLDKWIESCEEQEELFRKLNMEHAQITSQAMAQAYWNVKQLIEVNS